MTRKDAPVRKERPPGNVDIGTVSGFGDEWAAYDQVRLSNDERRQLFDRYFHLFPFDDLPPAAEGFDLGCGSGRWAFGVPSAWS